MPERKHADDEWFEISEDMWREPKFRPKKLKLLADAQLPQSVIRDIQRAGISISCLDQREARAADPNVLLKAHNSGRVLLTLDRDFWDDRKYPLHSICGGIIYVAASPDNPEQILKALALVHACFARSYPLDWWKHMKVKATEDEFELKMRTWRGDVQRYRIKVRAGHLVAKEVS